MTDPFDPIWASVEAIKDAVIALQLQSLPTVVEVTPSSGPVAGAGTAVWVIGTNLLAMDGTVLPSTVLNFGSVEVAPYETSSSYGGGGAGHGDQGIMVYSPAGSAGTVDVTVTNVNGTSDVNSPTDQFTFE